MNVKKKTKWLEDSVANRLVTKNPDGTYRVFLGSLRDELSNIDEKTLFGEDGVIYGCYAYKFNMVDSMETYKGLAPEDVTHTISNIKPEETSLFGSGVVITGDLSTNDDRLITMLEDDEQPVEFCLVAICTHDKTNNEFVRSPLKILHWNIANVNPLEGESTGIREDEYENSMDALRASAEL